MRLRMVISAAILGLTSLAAAGADAAEPATSPPSSEPAEGAIEIKLEDPEPGGTPVPGGRMSMMIRLDVTELDPHKMSETSAFVINDQIYESLVQYYRGEIEPAIAESWEVSEDGLTFTFQLRENAFFHSGRQVTSADVKYSLERILDPETAAPRAASYRSIESIETPDDLTVVLGLSEPNAALLTALSIGAASIVDREVADSQGLNGTVDGGSGPFMLASRVAGEEITLDRHPQYWEEGVPYLDGIDIMFNPDDNARAAAVRSGTVDFLWSAAPEFIETLKSDENLKWYGGAGALSLHLVMNVTRPPFDDVRVRQAVFFALDRQEILDIANSGLGTPLYGGFLPPGRYGALEEPIYGEPDLERARELMEEAGYADGFDVTLTVISTSAFQVRQAEVEQQQLAEIGINVTIETVEGTVAQARTREGDFEMYQSGFSLTPDPDERLTASFVTGGGLNYAGWSDPEYDEIIAAARAELDPVERERLYQESEGILATRGPAAMTFRNADHDVVQSYVMGYAGDPTPTYRFYKYLWLDQ